ncbi:MAG: response regulator [Actinomycetota bacterium]
MARVLVVDDDVDILNLVTARLRRAGHQVVSAGSGKEALELVAEKGPPEVAVLDVAMPWMNGLELLMQLRSQPGMESLPTVFLSAKVQKEDIEAGKALGALYLTKPFVAAALLDAITSLLPKEPMADSW